ncbi:hypothetical protein L484_020995 [Morus notabilis]|uniref:Uncharacterized protein n=1 Tax=Morus notabilis TaxID=981085 RepID=W9QQX0_9ROSA|nr:hypothetical protein L484_020995 [Morus notabilis]
MIRRRVHTCFEFTHVAMDMIVIGYVMGLIFLLSPTLPIPKESEERPTAAASTPPSSPPPPHPNASPIGSPDHALDDVHALLSNDERDHDLGHGDDGVHDEERRPH